MSDLAHKQFFLTLANKTRLEIVYLLRDGEKNVTQLSRELGCKQSTVSHNLKRLVKCEFVHVRQEGQHRYYRLNTQTIEPLIKLMDKHVAKFCIKKCCDK